MDAGRAADIVFACGAPGSGKSYKLHQAIAERRPARLIVIDPDGEYPEAGYLHTAPAELARATAYATFCTRYQPAAGRASAEKQFDFICRLVRWHVDPQPDQARPPRVAPVCLVIDELADLVGPSFRDTPESWQWIVRRGRKYGVSLIAASQRPAQIDKSLYDLASSIRVGRLNNADSLRSVASAIDVPIEQLRALTGVQFFERDKRTGALTFGPASSPPAHGPGLVKPLEHEAAKPKKRRGPRRR